MEKKTPNLGSWKRVLSHRFTVERVETPGFRGYVTRFYIDKVSEPRIKHQGNRTWWLAGDGFLWVQYFPDQCCHTIRTILNATGELEQWYIDICQPYTLDAQGVPTYIDLDLDVVVWPDGEVELWDADELDESLRVGAISKDDYDLAWKEARALLDALVTGRLILPKTDQELPKWVDR